MQVDGVAGLQTLVDRPPAGGAHHATAATAIPGVVESLRQPCSILVDIHIARLPRVIENQNAECYQVDSGTGCGENS